VVDFRQHPNPPLEISLRTFPKKEVQESELPKNILCKPMHSLVGWSAIGGRDPHCFQGIQRYGMAFQLH
jgi:hypothetical protein